jgi:hypothetical protein
MNYSAKFVDLRVCCRTRTLRGLGRWRNLGCRLRCDLSETVRKAKTMITEPSKMYQRRFPSRWKSGEQIWPARVPHRRGVMVMSKSPQCAMYVKLPETPFVQWANREMRNRLLCLASDSLEKYASCAQFDKSVLLHFPISMRSEFDQIESRPWKILAGRTILRLQHDPAELLEAQSGNPK